MNATWLWPLWQAVVLSLAVGFTRRGQQRFVQWVTGLALNVEEHTITQSVVALGRVSDWRALETFAEYGSGDLPALQRDIASRLARLPDRSWHGYSVFACDDTKVHRTSKGVWGTCTFHEYTARCPNRAQTVRAHNWVVLGALLPNGERPAHFLPVAARLYCRVRGRRAPVGQKTRRPTRRADTPPGVGRWSFACFASVSNAWLSQEITA